MRTPARVLPEPRTIVLQTRPQRWVDLLKVGLVAAVWTLLVYWGAWNHAMAYAEANAEKPVPAILQVTDDLLGVDETQLYPREPNKNVLWVDGAGRGLNWRMTPNGAEALRAWVGD